MRRYMATLVCAAAIAATAGAQEPRLELQKLMLTGETAPGIEPAVIDEIGAYVDIFNTDPFDGLAIAGPGDATAILAEHGGDGQPSTRDSTGSGVWRAGAVLERIALEGDVAPDTGGLTFTGFPNLFALSPAEQGGAVTFEASVVSDGIELLGLWSTRGGLHKLLLQNEPLTGMPAGATAFQFAFVGRGPAALVEANWCTPDTGCGGPDEGLWRDLDGTLRPVVTRGDPAPGMGRSAVFDDVSNSSARTGPVHFWNGSETGRVIFNGYTVGPQIRSTNNEGVWMEGAAGLTLLAREGDKIPGRPGFVWGAKSGFQSFGDFTVMRTPVLTANGLALWGASMYTGRYDRFGGVFTNRSGSTVQLVQTVFRAASDSPPQSLATPAPGFAPGHFFRQIFSGRMNTAGEVYLDADVVHEAEPSTPKPAIFRIRPGTNVIELVAAVGRPASGLAGFTLVEARIGRLFDTGHYLWIGRARNASGDEIRALYVTEPTGATRVLLKTGDAVDVRGDGSDLRVLSDIGTDSGLGANGDAVEQILELRFQDGSVGVFRARLRPE